jgi:hypothetical protein
MSLGSRVFIAIVFSIVGASFLATTGVMIWEFRDLDWQTIAAFYSHLFIFFPTFGIVTLVAFYIPACVFLDMYMKYVPYGPERFAIGFLVAIGISLAAANTLMGSSERSIFEVKPEVLRADAGEPRGCLASGRCERLPILEAMDNVRRVSQARTGLSDLARNCKPDTLKGVPAADRVFKRYCFASTKLPEDLADLREDQRSTDQECCRSQQRFTDAVNRLSGEPGGRSVTSQVHAMLLAFKVFFALILLVISVMLAWRRKLMELHYRPYLDAIERGVLVGAAAMVIYPLMSHAFLQSAALLYFGGGPSGGYRSTAPLLSFALGAWGLLLLFFFYRRRDKELESLARMGGVIGSAVAVVKYDAIVDFCVRLFGTGASRYTLAVLCVAALFAIAVLVRLIARELRKRNDQQPPARPAPAAKSERESAIDAVDAKEPARGA